MSSAQPSLSTPPAPPASEKPQFEPPKLVIEWEPWTRQFARHVADLFRPEPPALVLSSKPGQFWSDVFVPEARARRVFPISLLYHMGALAFMYVVPTLILLSQGVPRLQPHAPERSITWYHLSEYLPEIRSPMPRAKVASKGEPRLAPQRVISVPAHPDNPEQTILAPRVRLLPRHVELPNMVVATPILAAPQALPAPAPKLIFPFAPPRVIAPPVQAPQVAQVKVPALEEKQVVPPVAQVSNDQLAKVKLPEMSVKSVVPPAPSLDSLARKPGEINLAQNVQVEAPKLPVEAQRALPTGANTAGGGRAAATPPPPSVSGGGSATSAAGQLLALNLAPTAVNGPIPEPEGSRHGEFAAGPEGKPQAAGTPDIKPGGNNSAGAGSNLEAASDSPGVSVGPGPANAIAGPTQQAGGPNNGSTRPAGSGGNVIVQRTQPAAPTRRTQEMAAVEMPRAPLPDAPNIEERVFGGKRSYSLTMNMPNLSSAGGSWIIHFAELGKEEPGPLAAPQVLEKVDPAYPADVVRDRIEGVVTLYAVIRSDGTVGDVRVLNSLDERLDESARRALERWRFTPGLRNGVPVDLEAVVRIPFKLRRSEF